MEVREPLITEASTSHLKHITKERGGKMDPTPSLEEPSLARTAHLLFSVCRANSLKNVTKLKSESKCDEKNKFWNKEGSYCRHLSPNFPWEARHSCYTTKLKKQKKHSLGSGDPLWAVLSFTA
jgi:hypothetical protein